MLRFYPLVLHLAHNSEWFRRVIGSWDHGRWSEKISRQEQSLPRGKASGGIWKSKHVLIFGKATNEWKIQIPYATSCLTLRYCQSISCIWSTFRAFLFKVNGKISSYYTRVNLFYLRKLEEHKSSCFRKSTKEQILNGNLWINEK